MLASHKWLEELCGFALDPEQVALRLTSAGLEIEGVREHGVGLEHVVIAQVRSQKPHPSRDKLALVTIFDGVAEQEVVCGAPNVPVAGGLVLFARLGAQLPNGMKIEERKLGGVVSRGMLCGETELDIGSNDAGLLIVEPGAGRVPGAAVVDALALRDRVYSIGLTPNRPDCLGHLGIARELCALLDKPFTWPKPHAHKRSRFQTLDGAASWKDTHSTFVLDVADTLHVAEASAAGVALVPVEVKIAAPDRCPRYGAALVTGVRIAPSPFHVRYRLHVLGLRAISNVVDATNLVLLGFGHPIHAFDHSKLRGAQIEVRLARAGETMQTLDGQTRTLTADDLLICDGEGPVALAGVMGGGNSEISATTEDVLIECAYFDPRSVRRTSKRLGLHTDSSHRFERGVDPEAVRAVLAHASALVAELSGGTVIADALDAYPTKLERKHVTFRSARAAALLGTPVDATAAKHIFERLGCTVKAHGEQLDVVFPSHRPDLTREIDLIEEFARVRGYDSIPTLLPSLRTSSEGSAPEIGFVRKIRETCAALGLCEAVNFAFVSPADLQKARVPTHTLRLANPMSEERSVLRTAILPGLAQNLANAQRQALKRFAQHEVAHVFRAREVGALPDESYELGVMLWGMRHAWYDERDKLDFYDAKGVLESLTHALCGVACETVPADGLDASAPYLHPKRRAAVVLAGQTVGSVGELHPDVIAAYGLDGRPVYASLSVPALLDAARSVGVRKASSLPRFPAATRDLAVVVAEGLPAGDVERTLQEVAGSLVESVRLFDIYRGAPVPEDHKSLAFHVVYRDPTATLTDKLVDETHARLTQSAEQRFGASVRK